MAYRPAPTRLLKTRLGPWPLGLDSKASAYVLKGGKFPAGQNLLLDEEPGAFMKRYGMRLLSSIPSGTPRDAYVFSKQDGSSYLLVSNGTTLYYTTDPASGTWTTLKTGLSSPDFMEFETAEDKVWMTNGVDSPMSWDGSTLVIYDRAQTVTAASAAVTGTTISNAALTQADDYWNGQKLIFKSGVNAGVTVTVTDFDAATDTITFTPSVSGITVDDDFKVGLSLPKFKFWRFWDGHLWGFSSIENPSEGRFHRLTDPDTGTDITIDNPEAWPSTFQIDIYTADGDRLWGVSPVLRDRFLMFKSSGIFRMERDPLTLYRPEVVDRSIGSRFHRSWVEKDGQLYFVGQDADRLLRVYKTDMVAVRPVDKEGAMDNVLDAMRQPNSVQRTETFANEQSWDLGTKSTGILTRNGKLEIGGFNDADDWQGSGLVSGSNVDIETVPGKVGVLGAGPWDVAYEADQVPSSATPAWTARESSASGSVGSSAFTATASSVSGSTTRKANYRRESALSSAQDSYLSIRCKLNDSNNGIHFGLWNGARCAFFHVTVGNGVIGQPYDHGVPPSGRNIVIEGPGTRDYTAYHVYTVLLKSDGTWKLWIDGVRVYTGSIAVSSSINKVQFGALLPETADAASDDDAFKDTSGTRPAHSSTFDYVRYAVNFKGDSLSSFSGKVSPTTLPDTLPSSGNIVVLVDHTRAPDALRRLYHASTLNGGTVGMESWTSDTTDFTSGNDAAGYLSVANGDAPTSALKRAQRVRVTLTNSSVKVSPDLEQLLHGTLWTSPAIRLGTTITSWRALLATLTTPGGTAQTIQIRRATTTAEPTESDYGGFSAIVSGDNIGTILADGTPPTSRWVQIKVEQGPNSSGQVPSVDLLAVQWNEGADANLPAVGVTHKRRYMFCIAQNDSSANDRVLVWDRNEAPMVYVGWSLNWMGNFRGQLIGLSSGDSKVFELDAVGVYSDNGTAIDAYLETRQEVMGAEELKKDLRYGYVHCGDLVHDLSVGWKRPTDAAYTEASLSVDGSQNELRVNFPPGTVGRKFQRRYRNNTNNQGMKVYGETLYYAVRGPQPT